MSLFSSIRSIRDSGFAQTVSEMICIFQAAKGVYRKERLDRELRRQVQRRRGMLPCLVHLAQVSMACCKIGLDPIRLNW